jgi:CRISPR-associated protein Csd2
MSIIITNRHDVMVLFEVVNGNPNGDPDAGNLPRIDPTTNKGLVSDVCLKRKIRNFMIEFPTKREENENGFNIIVKQGNIINNELDKAIKEATENLQDADNKRKAEAAKNWLCKEFYDIRAFGGVLSTGDDVLKGSAYGQVRGPIQFTFGQSVHPITPLEISITRCAVTKPEDEKKERTMGNKHIVPYALYVGKVFISPAFAEKTGFTEKDLEIFFEALLHMFDHDQSAARPEMNVRGIFDFEHIGTQGEKNAEQNKREARLGCCHSHKLFDGIKADLSKDAKEKGKTYPESFLDYDIQCTWEREPLPQGVKLHLRHEGRIIPSNNGK